MLFNKTIKILSFLIFVVNVSQGQSNFEDVILKYSDRDLVFLKKKNHINIDVVSGSLKITNDVYYEKLFINDHANQYASEYIYYDGRLSVKNIEAKTIINENNKINIFKAKEFEEIDVRSPNVFYDDAKVRRISFPKLKKNARTILSYTQNIPAGFLTPYTFSDKIPVIESEFSITYSNKIKITNELVNITPSELIYTKNEHNNYITESWLNRNVKFINELSHAPDRRYYAPQIVTYIKEFEVSKNKIESYSADEKDLYKLVYFYIKNVNNESDRSLKNIVDSIVVISNSDLDKSKKIFNWVQDNIKYVAFGDGMEGYIPRNSNDIFIKRYGDCKDMSNLVTHMHKLAGLNATHSWIGTRDIPNLIRKSPVPWIFNHMISVVFINGKYYFLDATDRYGGYGIPTSMIQGKEALLSITKDSSAIITVPIVDMKLNCISDTVFIKIEKDIVNGKAKKYVSGYPKDINTYKLEGKSGAILDEEVKKILKQSNTKCDIHHYTINDFLSKEKPLKFEYDFTLEDYLVNINKELLINLNLNKDLIYDKINIHERGDIEYEVEYKYKIDQTIYFEIPSGYEVSYIPPNDSFQNNEFGFSMEYRRLNGKIELHKKMYINFILMNSNQFENWNKMIAKLNSIYKENITLIKRN